jgi:hypothetical protein
LLYVFAKNLVKLRPKKKKTTLKKGWREYDFWFMLFVEMIN